MPLDCACGQHPDGASLRGEAALGRPRQPHQEHHRALQEHPRRERTGIQVEHVKSRIKPLSTLRMEGLF